MTDSPQSSLCERCKVLEFDDSALGWEAGTVDDGVYWEYPQEEDSFPLDYCLEDSLPDLPVLSASSHQGCNFCSLLLTVLTEQKFHSWNTLKAAIKHEREWHDDKDVSSRDSLGLMGLVVTLDLASLQGNEYKTYLYFSIDGEPGPCRSWLRLQPSPKRRALGPGNLAWLQSIAEALDEDTKQLRGYLIPTRLIDVRATAASDCRLMVIDPDAPPTDTRYIALSYCWGTEEESKAQLTTQKATLKERQHGFTLVEASPILRDAVKVTRALGIRYLWVDALCIVQDDRLDWEQEAAKMSLVYRNAWLTTCVLNTNSCLNYFLERPPQYSTPIRFSSRLHTGIDGAYWVRWHGKFEREPPSFNHLSVDFESRWMTRGWTFQELYLSRNALLFGKHTMHYQTIKGTLSEGSNVHNTDSGGHPLFELEQLRRMDDEAVSGWIYYMGRASERNLTKPTDKLPSVSGMARIATQNCPQQYLAGIRRYLAHRDLMWSQQPFLEDNHTSTMTAVIDSLENQEPYIAPSWSWASRSSTIDYHVEQMLLSAGLVSEVEKECKSIEADIQVVSDANPFGEVSGGVLTVSGTILPIHSQQLRRLDVICYAYQAFMARIGSQNTAIIVPDGHFNDEEEPSQPFSLLLLGSCLPVRDQIKRFIFGKWEAQFGDQAETNDGFGEMSDSSSDYSDTRDARDFEVANHTALGEGGGRTPGSPQAYDDSEDGEDGPENEGGEAGAVIEDVEADWETVTDSEDGESDTGREAFVWGPRAAFGIVICPARRQQGKYLRVGIWSSPDGLDYLRAQEPKTVEIV